MKISNILVLLAVIGTNNLAPTTALRKVALQLNAVENDNDEQQLTHRVLTEEAPWMPGGVCLMFIMQ